MKSLNLCFLLFLNYLHRTDKTDEEKQEVSDEEEKAGTKVAEKIAGFSGSGIPQGKLQSFSIILTEIKKHKQQ